jgi:putative FmdB family regulatory protein
MPFYEYECSKCRYYLEVLQKISDAPLKKCPSCGKSALKKLVSAPVFRLKGSGWYETDFKSDQEGRRNLAGAEKDAPSAGAETKETGKDTANDAAKTAGTGDAKSGTDAKGDTAAASADGAKSAATADAAATARAGGRKRAAPPAARKAKKAVKRAVTRSARGKGKRRGAR